MVKNIVVCMTSRGNYARIGPVLHELDRDPEFELDIINAGAAMVRKYGSLSAILEDDGLEITTEMYNVLEGGNPVASAKTTGLSMMEFTNVLNDIGPDAVITIADRYETMAVTLAACYQNIPIIHTQGGEITGSIDEKVRHATTKLADYHMVSTERSAEVVSKLGEDPTRVYQTGCPSIDIAKEIAENENENYDPQEQYTGVGKDVDVTEDYVVVQYHPVPTGYESQYDKAWTLIRAIDELDVQAFWFWPNMDAGTDQVSKAIREYRDQRDPQGTRFYINMRPKHYLTLISNSACLVGNSSVGIRECSYLGQPSINIGGRQNNRERAENVIDTACDTEAIIEAVKTQLEQESYEQSTLYGDGNAAEKMVDAMREIEFELKGSMDPTRLGLPSTPTLD
jgi:UDP-hydrolysing UDP-N-acetyl-D-glucosamine 2-epimerase